MQAKRILILGGTRDARQLAFRLIHAGHDVTTSFAGVTENPIQPEGKVRVGGFGGANVADADATGLGAGFGSGVMTGLLKAAAGAVFSGAGIDSLAASLALYLSRKLSSLSFS